MKKLLALAGIALLSGCTTLDSEAIPHPDGGIGYVVQCNGPTYTWGACYNMAKDICGSKYYQVDDRKETARAIGGFLLGGSLKDRSIVVRCEQPVDFSD